MVSVVEKINVQRDVPAEHLYYDIREVDRKFKLPLKKQPFLFDLLLVSYFCLRNKRFREISLILFKLIKHHGTPQLLLNAIIELGSTFIKIGQFLSSRTDLLPKEFILALSKLQDSLPPIPFSEVKSLVEKELRKPLDAVFQSFEKEPIASASIGQVHKAELLSGQSVVVKIQRPDLNTLFYQDLAILRCLAVFFERHTALGKYREWVQMVDEVGRTLFEEIDFIQEGRNADKLRKNLKYEERTYIPKIFWQYTTRKLITIEYVPGIKITDIDSLAVNNINPKELAVSLVNIYFKQFFEDGFYHADPHPGNIVVRKRGDDPEIVFYDFGMVGRINKQIRDELAGVLISVIGNDTETLIATLKRLELIKPGVDIEPIKRVIEQAAYKYYDGEKLESLALAHIEDDLEKLFREKPMRLPSKFTYTLRATGELEGVCRTLDPDFSLTAVAKPFLQNWILKNTPGSTWTYLKALFPEQSKFIDKVKIYVGVLKDLPKYVAGVEHGKDISEDKKEQTDMKTTEEIKGVNVKLQMAYSVIFLLCFVVIGNFLITSNIQIISIVGLLLLCISLFSSIWLVYRYFVST